MTRGVENWCTIVEQSCEVLATPSKSVARSSFERLIALIGPVAWSPASSPRSSRSRPSRTTRPRIISAHSSSRATTASPLARSTTTTPARPYPPSPTFYPSRSTRSPLAHSTTALWPPQARPLAGATRGRQMAAPTRRPDSPSRRSQWATSTAAASNPTERHRAGAATLRARARRRPTLFTRRSRLAVRTRAPSSPTERLSAGAPSPMVARSLRPTPSSPQSMLEARTPVALRLAEAYNAGAQTMRARPPSPPV